jgi:ABC-2 type transport system permease protein
VIVTEWYKEVLRPRTYAIFGIVALFPIVLTLALATTGPGQVEYVGDLPLLMIPRSSGLSVPVIALSSTMKFFLPLAVSLFAAESVAGDASWGSLRYALARPISRSRVLWSKATVAGLLCVSSVVVLIVVALLIGGLSFGWHSLSVTDVSTSTPAHPRVVVVNLGAMMDHLGVAALYVVAGMASIFAIAFFLSTTTRRPLVAVAGGVGLTIVSRIFNADYFPGIHIVNRYMPNNDIDLWQHLLTRPADLSGIPHFLTLQAAYVVVFMVLAHVWFVRKDILD